MEKAFKEHLLQTIKAKDLKKSEHIQNLWSGYGSLDRYLVEGLSDINSVIVKEINFPLNNTQNISHQRKIFSYGVEMNWYRNFSESSNPNCYIPKSYALTKSNNGFIFALEDLKEKGFSEILTSVSTEQVKVCLSWLAHFHACYFQQQAGGLWETGTYWHLDTRPDEFAALTDTNLKNAAVAIDEKLKGSKFQTLVHGDAKLANFCFSKCGNKVAAVDFQYVGGGCGMKDVAYLIGSCLREEDCEKYEQELLAYYFDSLSKALKSKIDDKKIQAITKDWDALYVFAWADFHRFLKGWSPSHWKINSYSEQMAKKAISLLK